MSELLNDANLALTQQRIVESAKKRRRLRATVQPAYLRTSDVADKYSLSLSTIYKLVRDGVLPSIRIASSIRISAAALDAYIAAQEGR
jgi:excisionase family DNA binding protein